MAAVEGADLLTLDPRGTCAILDRTGHLLFAEPPALLAARTAEWLDRVQEYLGSSSAQQR